MANLDIILAWYPTLSRKAKESISLADLHRLSKSLRASTDAAIEDALAENNRLRAFLENPPKHDFWRAGEPDCPRDIKAGNGELHTLRCKACGIDSPRDDMCTAALAKARQS